MSDEKLDMTTEPGAAEDAPTPKKKGRKKLAIVGVIVCPIGALKE